MAKLLWGKVFYHDHFAGFLQEEPGNCASFKYDTNYLESNLPPISHTLPLRGEAYNSPSSLHPFFDNLIAEGWLEEAQKHMREPTRTWHSLSKIHPDVCPQKPFAFICAS